MYHLNIVKQAKFTEYLNTYKQMLNKKTELENELKNEESLLMKELIGQQLKHITKDIHKFGDSILHFIQLELLKI